MAACCLGAIVVALALGALAPATTRSPLAPRGPTGAKVGVAGAVPTLTPVKGPPGWQAADWGFARLWAPNGWMVASPYSGACTWGTGLVLLGNATELSPCRGKPLAVVALRALGPGPAPRGARRTVNGIPVWVTPAAGRGLVARAPSLGVQVTMSGSVPPAVLASLGPSPLGIVLGAGPARPPGLSWRTVTYQGLSAQVPASWPVVDGDHAGPCESYFTTDGEVLVGPDNVPVVTYCPDRGNGFAGLWLQPARGFPYTPPAHYHVLKTPSGLSFRTYTGYLDGPPVNLWYRGVSIELGTGGTGSAAEVVRAVFGSLRPAPGRPDTVGAGACPVGPPPAMPHPARLGSRLSFEYGNIVLDPPLSSDVPGPRASRAWAQAGKKHPYDRYRLLLARYQGQLVWAVYSLPVHTDAGDCGTYSLYVYDARTGALVIEIA